MLESEISENARSGTPRYAEMPNWLQTVKQNLRGGRRCGTDAERNSAEARREHQSNVANLAEGLDLNGADLWLPQMLILVALMPLVLKCRKIFLRQTSVHVRSGVDVVTISGTLGCGEGGCELEPIRLLDSFETDAAKPAGGAAAARV